MLFTTASIVQGELQSRARSSYAEPQPLLAMYLQVHGKGTKKNAYLQISRTVVCENLLIFSVK